MRVQMRATGIISAVMLAGALVVSCGGESDKERQAREAAERQHVADSIAREEARIAAEQHRQDSIEYAARRAERMAQDSVTKAELLPAFTEDRNADESGASVFKIKNAPKGRQGNYAYLSFSVDNDKAREMFINVCCTASDWLYIEGCTIEADNDETAEISVGETSDNVNNNLSCSEWFTAPVYSGTLDMLMNAKSAKVIIRGKEKKKEIPLSAKQLADIQKTIRLYRAYGG